MVSSGLLHRPGKPRKFGSPLILLPQNQHLQTNLPSNSCAGCSYTSGCCCPKRHPVTTSIRPAPATKTITVTAKKQNARAYYAVDYPEQVSEEAAEDEAEEETLMSVRAAAAAPAAAAADGRHNCALCPAGIVVAPFKKGKTSANYCW